MTVFFSHGPSLRRNIVRGNQPDFGTTDSLSIIYLVTNNLYIKSVSTSPGHNRMLSMLSKTIQAFNTWLGGLPFWSHILLYHFDRKFSNA